MNKTESGESSMIQDLSDSRRLEKPISSINSFTPKYLNLHQISETSNSSCSDKDSSKYAASKSFRDVVLISEEGEIFLCNKLYLIR